MTAGVETIVLGAERLSALHAEERQQKDNLCGCFWGSLVLRAHGFDADQDEVAMRAGSILPHPSDDDVPPGAAPRQDYRLPIPVVDEHGITGTAAPGVAAAIEELSTGALRVISVAGPWNADSVVSLCETAADATLIANVRTGLFWGSHPSPALMLDALAGRPVEPPPPDWDVGHFVSFAALLCGPGGSLVVIRDTYPTLGWDGYYPQPPAAVAAALERSDGRGGGVLCVAPTEIAERVRGRLAERFELHHWDNGTPYS